MKLHMKSHIQTVRTPHFDVSDSLADEYEAEVGMGGAEVDHHIEGHGHRQPQYGH